MLTAQTVRENALGWNVTHNPVGMGDEKGEEESASHQSRGRESANMGDGVKKPAGTAKALSEHQVHLFRGMSNASWIAATVLVAGRQQPRIFTGQQCDV